MVNARNVVETPKEESTAALEKLLDLIESNVEEASARAEMLHALFTYLRADHERTLLVLKRD